jgi:hypothetical protein
VLGVARELETALADMHACTIFLARDFPKYLDMLLESTDEVFALFLSSFVKLARKVRRSHKSVRCGDSIGMERAYTRFIPIWLLLQKKYYLLGLDQIDQNYGRLPFKTLEFYRHNRSRRLYRGQDKDGEDFKHHPLDDLMELQMPKFKSMNIPNTNQSWQESLPLMPVVSRSKIFTQTEFSRTMDVDALDRRAAGLEPEGKNRSRSKTCSTKKPRVLIQTSIPISGGSAQSNEYTAE